MGCDEAGAVRDVIRRRRVTRAFLRRGVSDRDLMQLADAAARAPSGGDRRPIQIVVLGTTPEVRRVAAFSPGIIGVPQAVVALCIDWSRVPHLRPGGTGRSSVEVDVGAAMENVLLLAEAKGLGACPVMSFHRRSVATVLGLDPSWTPMALVTLGYPKKVVRLHAPKPPTTIHWGSGWSRREAGPVH
jgi:nitroreductase